MPFIRWRWIFETVVNRPFRSLRGFECYRDVSPAIPNLRLNAKSALPDIDRSGVLHWGRWGNVVVDFYLWHRGFAGTAGNEQDVIGSQRHIPGFGLHDLP